MPTHSESFDSQLQHLLDIGYPSIAGMSESEFKDIALPLKNHLKNSEIIMNTETGKLSFVIVVTSKLVPTKDSITKITRQGKTGFEKLFPHQPDTFQPIADIKLPSSQIYLLLDIDRGQETLNITPEVAFRTIADQNRSPLTIDEGIAILTQFPDFIQKNNCFSLLGSRTQDKRVPAFWLSDNRPKLGWCWNGNPHTWLGSASCNQRIG